MTPPYNQKEDKIMVKIFRNSNMQELSREVSDFYNRQGRIGNRLGNAKLHRMENGDVVVTLSYTGKEDDGRQIDDIEDRKHILITKIADTDSTEINEFLKAHEDGYFVAQPYFDAFGNELLCFMVATKITQVNDDWGDDDEDDEDDEDYSLVESEIELETGDKIVLPSRSEVESHKTCPDFEENNGVMTLCSGCPAAANKEDANDSASVPSIPVIPSAEDNGDDPWFN
jgi:hypothetical protein